VAVDLDGKRQSTSYEAAGEAPEAAAQLGFGRGRRRHCGFRVQGVEAVLFIWAECGLGMRA